jgi:hypothetical protein
LKYIKIIYFFVIYGIVGCKQETTQYQTQYKGQATEEKNATFTHFEQIILRLCQPIAGCEIPYAGDNTRFIFLSQPNQDSVFAVESSIQCGCMGGSCGNDIQILRKENNEWKNILSVCGYNIQEQAQSEGEIAPSGFSFDLRGANGYPLKVNLIWQQKTPLLDTLFWGEFPYPLLKQVLKDEKECFPSLDCNTLRFLHFDSLPSSPHPLWVVKNTSPSQSPVTFLINPTQNYKILHRFEGLDTLYLASNAQTEYPNIIVETMFLQEVWKWNKTCYEKLEAKKIY